MTQPLRPPITDERLDRLVRQVLTERAEDVAAAAPPADAMAERIATSLRPTRSGSTRVLLAAALLAALLIGGTIAVGGQLRLQSPPAPHGVEWTGPLRSHAPTLPSSVRVEQDGRDTEPAWVDIVAVRNSGFRRWDLELAGLPPLGGTLDPAQRIIEYGVVVDANADGVADCLIGINNDQPLRGHFRVWVTDVATGTTLEQVGPPYGYPIEFRHPDKHRDSFPPTMAFWFLSGIGTAPCVLAAGDQRFYAWASLTESGHVTAWDYAPDAGWLP
jgi:hypothetical protein